MVKRMIGAVIVAVVVASPTALFAQGPGDFGWASALVKTVAQHNCEAAGKLAAALGVKAPLCPKG